MRKGRFTGWSEAKIAELMQGQDLTKEPGVNKLILPKKKIDSSNGKKIVNAIVQALATVKIDGVVNEHCFSNVNKRRFDIAIVPNKIAIEYEGGTWNGGGHVRGKTYSDNCKKYNEAQTLGWFVLRYTADMCQKKNWEYGVVADVQKIISLKEKQGEL